MLGREAYNVCVVAYTEMPWSEMLAIKDLTF